MKIDKFREESENNLSRNEANSTIKHIGLMVAFDNVNYYQNCLFKNKKNKIVKNILIIGNVSNNSSRIPPSVQVLRQQIGGMCFC